MKLQNTCEIVLQNMIIFKDLKQFLFRELKG